MSNSNKIASPGPGPSGGSGGGGGGSADQILSFPIPEELTILKIDPENPSVHLKKPPSSDMNSVDIFHMNPNLNVTSVVPSGDRPRDGVGGDINYGDNNIEIDEEYMDEVELEMEIEEEDEEEYDDDGNHPMAMMFETELIEGDDAVKEANKNTTPPPSSLNCFPPNSNQYQLTDETTVTKINDPMPHHQHHPMTVKKSPPPLLSLNLSPIPSNSSISTISSSSFESSSLGPPTLTLVQHHHPSPDSNLSITTVSPSPPTLQPQNQQQIPSPPPVPGAGVGVSTPFKRQNGPGRPRRKTEHKIIRTEFISNTLSITSSSATTSTTPSNTQQQQQQLNILSSSNSNQNQPSNPLSPYVYRTRTSLRNSIAMQNKKIQQAAAAAAEKAAAEKKNQQIKQQQQRQNIKPNIVTPTTTAGGVPRKPGIRLPGRPPLSLSNRPPPPSPSNSNSSKINSQVSKEKEKFLKKVLSSTFPQRPRPRSTIIHNSSSSSSSSVASSVSSASHAASASGEKAGPGRPRKRLNRKLSAAEQLEQTKKDGCIDLETPSSFLANVNLRAILNKHTFSLLPPLYQYKLIQLLPEPDNSSIKLSSSALNNEFFAKACSEWSTKLLAGEFESEHKMSKKEEAKREKLKLDPWKLKHFEPIWGQKSINKPLVINMDCLTPSTSLMAPATSNTNNNNNSKKDNNKQQKPINNLPKMYNPDMRRISSRCSLRLSPKIEPTPTSTTSNPLDPATATIKNNEKIPIPSSTTPVTNKRKSGELLEDVTTKDNQVVKKLKVLTPLRVQQQQQQQQNTDTILPLEKVEIKIVQEKVGQIANEKSQNSELEISKDLQDSQVIEENKKLSKNPETDEKNDSMSDGIQEVSQIEVVEESPATPLSDSSKPTTICDVKDEPESSGELLIITLPSKPTTSSEQQQQQLPNKKIDEIQLQPAAAAEIPNSEDTNDISSISHLSSDITIKRTNIIENKNLQQSQQQQPEAPTTTIEKSKSDQNNAITIMQAKSPLPPQVTARSPAPPTTPSKSNRPADDQSQSFIDKSIKIKTEEPPSISAEDENKIPPEIKRIIPSTVTVVARTISPQLQLPASPSSTTTTTTTSKNTMISVTSFKPTQVKLKPQSSSSAVVLKIIPNQIVTQENQIIIPGSSKTIVNRPDLCSAITSSSVKPKVEKVETTTTASNDDIKIFQHNIVVKTETENIHQHQQLIANPINKSTIPMNTQSSNSPSPSPLLIVEKKPENPIINSINQQSVNTSLSTTITTTASLPPTSSVSSPSSTVKAQGHGNMQNNPNPLTITTAGSKSSRGGGGGKSKQSQINKKGPSNSNSTPPGQVNLERSYAICQAVIQNSPNRDQLQNQLLKPPPIPKTQTMTIISTTTSSNVHSNHGSPVQQQQQQSQGDMIFSSLMNGTSGALRGGGGGGGGSHRVSPGPALVLGDGRTTSNYIHSQLPSSIQLTTTAAAALSQQQQQSQPPKVIVMPNSNVLPISTKPIVRPLSAPSQQQQSQIMGHQYAAGSTTAITTANNASSSQPSTTHTNNNTTTTLNITPQQLALLLQQQDKLTTANLPQFLNLIGKNATVANISNSSRTRTPSPLTTTTINQQQQQQNNPNPETTLTSPPTTTTIKILNSAQMQRIIMQGQQQQHQQQGPASQQQQPQAGSGNNQSMFPVKAQILTSNGETLTIHRASFPSSPAPPHPPPGTVNTNNNNNVITTMRSQQQQQQQQNVRVRAPFTQLVSMGQVRGLPQQSYIVSTSTNQQQQQQQSNPTSQAIGGFRIIQSSSEQQVGGPIGPLSNLADFITNQIANSNIRPISPLNSTQIKTGGIDIDPNRVNTSSPSYQLQRKLSHPNQIFVEDLINSSSSNNNNNTSLQQQPQQSMIFTSSSGNMTIRPSTPNILLSTTNSQIQIQNQRKQQQQNQFGTNNPNNNNNNFTFSTNTSSTPANNSPSPSFIISTNNNNNNNNNSKIESQSSNPPLVSLDRNTIIIQQDNKEKGKPPQQQQFIIVHTTGANGVPTSFAVPASILQQQSQQQQQPGTSGQQQQQKLIPPTRASSAPPNQQQNILTTSTTGSPQFVNAGGGGSGSSSTIYLNGSNLETRSSNNNVQENIRVLLNSTQFSQPNQNQQQQMGQNKLYFSAPPQQQQQQQQQQIRGNGSRVFTQPQQNNIIRLHVNQPGSFIQQQLQSSVNNIRTTQHKVPPLVGQGPGGQIQVLGSSSHQNPSSVMTAIKIEPRIITVPGQHPVISIPDPEGSQQQQQQHGGGSGGPSNGGGSYMNGGDFDIFKVIDSGPSKVPLDGSVTQNNQQRQQQQNILVEDMGGLGGGVVVDGSGNCICDLRAYIMCRKCGVFCHDDCMQQNSNLCMTCMI